MAPHTSGFGARRQTSSALSPASLPAAHPPNHQANTHAQGGSLENNLLENKTTNPAQQWLTMKVCFGVFFSLLSLLPEGGVEGASDPRHCRVGQGELWKTQIVSLLEAAPSSGRLNPKGHAASSPLVHVIPPKTSPWGASWEPRDLMGLCGFSCFGWRI